MNKQELISGLSLQIAKAIDRELAEPREMQPVFRVKDIEVEFKNAKNRRGLPHRFDD